MSIKSLEKALIVVDQHAADASDGVWLEKLVTELGPEIAAWDLAEAWLWEDWPHRNEVLPNATPDDDGIDVVGRRQDGSWCAIQCKARRHVNGKPGRLTKEDIRDFGSATNTSANIWAEGWIVTNADISDHVRAKMRGLGETVANVREVQIGPAIHAEITARKAAKPDPRDAMQERAVGAIIRGLDNVRATPDKAHAGWRLGDARATAVMPCGTGKTRVAYEVARQTAANGLVCVLAPSIGLVRQLRAAWLGWARTTGDTLQTLSVCSDPKVADTTGERREREEAKANPEREDPTEDRSLVSATELTGTVAASGDDIADWLRRTTATGSGRPVIFCTYQSGHHLSAALLDAGAEAALLVCDEAHRTSGIRRPPAKRREAAVRNFLLCHDAARIPARNRLYMTATPRVHRRGDKLPPDLQISTMDDEAVFGPVAYRLTYRDAVQQGLLSDYRIIAVAVSQEGCAVGEQLAQETRKRVEEESDAGELDDPRRTSTSLAIRKVALALALAGGVEERGGERLRLRSAIAFCNKVSRSRDLASELGSEDLQNAVLGLLPTAAPHRFAIEHRDAGHSAPERADVLKRLASATPDAPFAVTNVGIFGEGIDTPDLDAVAFIEARRSPVDVVQAVGRVMRLSPGKRMGYILVPVLIPPGQHPEAWLESRRDTEGWQELGQVLCALQSHDARIEHLLGEMLHIAAPAKQDRTEHLVGLRTSLGTDVWFWEGPAGELEYALDEGTGSARERLEKAGDLRPAAQVVAVPTVPCGTWLVDDGRLGRPRVATFDTLSSWEENDGEYATAPAVEAVRQALVMEPTPGPGKKKVSEPRFRSPAKRPTKDRSPKPDAAEIPGLLREIQDTGIRAESIRLNLLEKSGLLGGSARDFNVLRETVERAAGCLRAEELEGELRAELGMESISEEARSDSADACTVAALMFMTGAILHARLEHGEALRGRNVGRLAAIAGSGTPAEDLLLAWQRILDTDYRPVFGLARDILLHLTRHTRRTTGLDQAVRGIAHDAGDIAETYTDMGMDYAGELFNQVMGNQAADGAYFTRPAPAVLMAELVASLLGDEVDWTKQQTWRQATAFDPACGSGTLLVSLAAAFKRRAYQQGADERTLARMHRYLVEEGLTGLDINPVSLQLAGAQLTLGDTRISYRNMGLSRMPYGLDAERAGEPAAAGSLELLTDERVVGEPRPGEQADWVERTYRGADRVERVALRENEPREQEGVLDDVVGEVLGRRIAIMNPPFVTRDKLGRKFGRDEQIAIRKRIDAAQAVLESRCPGLAGICEKTSTRPLYVALGLRCIDPDDGMLAMVIPTVALTSPSGREERRILGQELHVRLVVTCHEPGNVNVSQRTAANESLVIGTRADRGTGGPTLFASLDRMPGNVESAVELAAAIAAGQPHGDIHVRAVSAERVAAGDWSAAGWRNPALDEAVETMDGWEALVRIRDVSGVTIRAPGQGAYVTEPRPWRSRRIFNSKAGDAQQRLAGEPDTEAWLKRAIGSTPEEQAAHERQTWERHRRDTAGHLMVITGQAMDSARVNTVVCEQPQVGMVWKPVQGISLETAKAWAIWLNSTPGRLTMLAQRGGKRLAWPTWRPLGLREIFVPNPERDELIKALARGFDALSGTVIERYDAGYTPVRQQLDAAVAEALGNGAGDRIAEWARLLNEEPVVCPTGFWRSRANA